ncbi:hypothetical protein [Streptomyces sp. NPDC049813]|uniref:hypothetical protein n=1 Tax=Streptomyces sp. NPDC049813 TaxID=3365597 RepID=UPI0037AA1040
MGTGRPRRDVRFEPTRPASRNRRVVAFLLGALVWVAAGVLAVVLLGHSYILRRLLLALVVSWVVFGLASAWGIALRHRQERA